MLSVLYIIILKEVVHVERFVFLACIASSGRDSSRSPVSYTHLDVYKRQSLYRHRIRLAFNAASNRHLCHLPVLPAVIHVCLLYTSLHLSEAVDNINVNRLLVCRCRGVVELEMDNGTVFLPNDFYQMCLRDRRKYSRCRTSVSPRKKKPETRSRK